MYQCQDCTHKGKVFTKGVCPACGSANIRRIKTADNKQQPVARKGFRISLSTVLWIYLAIGIYRRYFLGDG